ATPVQSSNSILRAPLNGIQIVPAIPGPPPPPDFALGATPASLSVRPLGTARYSVNVSSLNGFSGTVTLAASGLPAHASATFTPQSVTGSGSATLDVSTTSSTALGDSTVVITGTSGTVTHSTSVTLSVRAGSAIGVDFVGTGTAMGPTETAGAVPKTHWNS